MICVSRLIDGHDPAAVFKGLANQPYLLFFDSADQNHPDSLVSYIMCNPVDVISFKAGALRIENKDGLNHVENACPFDFIKERLSSFSNPVQSHADKALPTFRGGAAGFFGYDLGRQLEKLPENAAYDTDLPDMVIGIYDCVYAYDHRQNQAYIIANADHKDAAQEKLQRLEEMINQGFSTNAGLSQDDFVPQWRENFTRLDYEATLQNAIDYIHSGDIFQANITRRFDADLPEFFDPLMHYLHLRKVNPAPFAAYFNAGNGLAISSASPERFLSMDKKGFVQTKPIKGTRPVIAHDPDLDRAQAADLLASEKDRAENIMIVDLLRNDLSKTCQPHSIDVPHLCALESFANVHHLVSTVTGQIKPHLHALDIIKGCFPGGSITGAPKIRAMEIIEELEPTRRGPYCGSMGYIGFDGAMDSNILIRTLVYWKGAVSFQVGGGIVADSDPAAEFDETLTKAKGLLDSFKPYP